MFLLYMLLVLTWELIKWLTIISLSLVFLPFTFLFSGFTVSQPTRKPASKSARKSGPTGDDYCDLAKRLFLIDLIEKMGK